MSECLTNVDEMTATGASWVLSGIEATHGGSEEVR